MYNGFVTLNPLSRSIFPKKETFLEPMDMNLLDVYGNINVTAND